MNISLKHIVCYPLFFIVDWITVYLTFTKNVFFVLYEQLCTVECFYRFLQFVAPFISSLLYIDIIVVIMFPPVNEHCLLGT